MADQVIASLGVLAAPDTDDVLPIYSISASDTKKITVKNLVQQGAALVDNASIPVAKVNLSGINGSNISAGTIAASKLDTATIPATGGVTVSSNNLQLVAPTSPIVRNAGTGSLEHATSGVTAGTYTKVTVDTKGHVTAGTTLVGADVPVATSAVIGGVSVPAAGGLALTGGGALSHSNTVAGGASTRSGITYDAQGHIVSTVALVASDLPVATNAVKGAVIAGTGLAVDGNGILSTAVATTSDLGGIKIGSEFGLNGSNQLLLATQANVAGGTAYPKVTVNSKGVVTAGAALTASDIPSLDASKITTGSVDIARIAANTITGAKLANYAVSKIGDTQPTADHIGQFFFNPISRDLFLFDGNVFQPIGISVGEIVFAGTFDASVGGGTGHVASVTAEGTAIGLVSGSPLPAAATANNRYYLVVSEAGTITSGNAPNVALAPPDIILSTGIQWTEIDVSQTFTSVSASQVSFSPEGTIAANNVQAAIEEVNNEKLSLTGGTVTGNLEIGTAGSLSFEGSTANAFETTLAVVDPTADRTITLPNETGTVIVSGNASIVNADISAGAAIAYSKLATLTSGNIVLGNSANVATSTAVTGDITISNTGVTSIAAGVIVDADVNASAAIADTKLATISTANKVGISAIDIDGGTDIGAALADVDLFIVDDGGGGTNRKAAATRITDYAFGKVSGDITISSAGTAAIGSGVIVNADIASGAAIADTKLATISTAGKVSNSATTATNANTASAIVARDASGNFSAGTISAALTGNASTATALATARNIQGVSFDGSANITVVTAGSGISVAGTAVSNTGVLSVNGSTGAISNVAVTNSAQSFSAAQRGTISALTDGATITPDFAAANNFSVTLGGNRTLANPSNLTAGQSGAIWITQDGTGSRTLAYGSYWDFTGGTAPTLTTTANARDCLVYAVQSSTQITATLITNLS